MSEKSQDLLSLIAAKAAEIRSAERDARHALQHQYLELVAQHLVEVCENREAAFPMLDIVEDWDAIHVSVGERRNKFAEASSQLMAQISAVVDILISAGYSCDHACQIVSRQMIAREVKVPAGGDARGWRNLLAWRHKLLASKHEGMTWHTYATYKDHLLKTHGTRVGELAARSALWDRRQVLQPA